MKESKFIEQNKNNWQEFETELKSNSKTSSRLSRLYVSLTDDLSYARTFYNKRSIKVYLNGVAKTLFTDLYSNQTGSYPGFLNFWKYDLPMQIYESRKEFRISFFLFFISFCIGILSSIYDHDFARFILSDKYVDMTLANIQNNDPMAVYKSGNQLSMFLGITINNLTVALYCFLLGLFFSVGTLLILIKNGIMVGVFQYFFYEKGLLTESFLSIWQHGTIEISCIIIAGAAGLTLGNGLIFPGSFTRLQSLKLSALRGMKIFLGIFPLIVLAAFIEGFITRHTEISHVVRLFFILLSFGFIVIYFIWYPLFVKKTKGFRFTQKSKLTYVENKGYDFSLIQNAEKILGHTFAFIKTHVSWFALSILGFATLHAITNVFYYFFIDNSSAYTRPNLLVTFYYLRSFKLLLVVMLITTVLIQMISFYKLKKVLQAKNAIVNNQSWKGSGRLFLAAFIVSFILVSPFYFNMIIGIISLVLFSPLLFLLVFTSYMNNRNIFRSLPELGKLLGKSLSKLYRNGFKISGLIVVFYLMMNTSIAWHYIEGVFLNFNFNSEIMSILEVTVIVFMVSLVFTVFLIAQVVTSAFSYFAFYEIVYADHLFERIRKFGDRSVLFGFDKEVVK